MKKVLRNIIVIVLIISIILGLLPIKNMFVEEALAAYSATEEDLFYKCPEYLDNYPYNNYLSLCNDSIREAMEDVTKTDEVAASFFYSLQKGFVFLAKDIGSKFGLTDNVSHELQEEIIKELIVDYANTDMVLSSKAEEWHNEFKKVKTGFDWGDLALVTDYKNHIKSLNTGLKDKEVDKIVDGFAANTKEGKELMEKVGRGFDVAEIMLSFMELALIEKELLYDIYFCYRDIDSEFANIVLGMCAEREDMFLHIYNCYLEDEMFDELVKLLSNIVPGAGDLNKLMKLVGFTLEKSLAFSIPSVSTIVQSNMCISYMNMCDRLVKQCQKEFITGTFDETTIDKFKMAYSMYLSFTKTTMDKVKGCVDSKNKWKKDTLDSRSGPLCKTITYDSYIDSCLKTMQDDIASGKLDISDGVHKATPDGEKIDENYDSTESIKAKLAVIMNKYPAGTVWTEEFDGATQCLGFGKLVFYNLFGRTLGTTYVRGEMYKYYDTGSIYAVSQISGQEVTAANVKNTMAAARIGDLIQVYGATYGQHTMIFLGLTDDGIRVYDCNAHLNGDTRDCVINDWTISYSTLASWYGTGDSVSNNGISVYRASNYGEIYGNGEDLFYDDSVNFVIEDGVLVKYKGNQSHVRIPDGVTEIGEGAFCKNYKDYYGWKTNDTMMSVYIPDSVTSIGKYAFCGCDKLASILIPDSVTEIKYDAFRNCNNLSSVKLSNNLKKIGEQAFYNLEITEIKIPKSLEYGKNAFDCCRIKKVFFEKGTVKIADNLFSGCSIESIEIPNGVTRVVGVRSKKVFFEKGTIKIADNLFSGCSSIESIEIPDGVTEIGKDAFDNCNNLTNVKLPNSLKVIGENAFGGFSKITEIKIPKSVEDGERAFWNCSNLKTVVFEEGITRIPSYLFCGCDGIESIEIPNSVTEIGEHAFIDCDNLTNVKLSNNLKVIGSRAFGDCDNLTNVKLPKSIENGSFAFDGCSNLKTVVFEEGITRIPSYLFYGCDGIESIEIPDSVTEIGEYAFGDCDNLTNVKLPKSIENGSFAFDGCSNLKTVVFEEGITRIPSYLFCGCDGIESIEIPDSVTEIGEYAFSGCDNLTNVKLSNNLKVIESWAFMDCEKITKIKIPKSIENVNRAFGDCSNLKTVVFEEGITRIPSYLFYGCDGIESIEIPDSVTEIGEYAFSGCDNLTNVKLSNNLKVIGSRAFMGCEKITKIKIPKSVEDGNSVFSGCSNLKTVVFEEGITRIASKLFDGCDGIESIEIPNSVTEIGEYAFVNCEKLADIAIPPSTTAIADNAFSYPKKMTITGIKDSYAEEYANKKGIKFAESSLSDISSTDNIHIEYTCWDIAKNITLKTKKLKESDSEYKNIAVGSNVKFTAYDIKLTDESNNAVQPQVSVTVKIPCPAGYNGTNCKVYYSDKTGKLTDMKAKYAEGYMVFSTDHFSTYLITEAKLETSEAVKYGDINGDGNIDTQDAVLIKKYLAGYKGINVNLESCDVNSDGRVTSADVVLLLKYLAGYKVVLGK